ncbi:MAG: serine/threonine protein kinase [Planctomycetaceae bacterium]|nr:serine/threonine protein kinase [Planctomycetaceae bacterium]
MSTDRRIDEDLKFIETCVELKLLSETDAETLRQVIVESKIFAAQESLQRGLLTAADVDIVHSLRHPLDVVPGYDILGLVGRGGMGVVYRAKQLDLDRIVALKTVLISNISSSTVAARFEREAKALARLQHPNIVQALNFGKHLGRYYFAMEYVMGRSCEQALHQEGRLTPEAAWSIARQVASGLLHAFRQNVIHRDIKPANLLLLQAPEGSMAAGGEEVVKITDFGLAMFADAEPEQMRLTTGDKIMGSPAYMSPEQFGGEAVDYRADIYSLGATVWHLIFGTPPFQGKNLASLLSQKSQPIQADRRSLPIQISDDQWQLLMRMLNPDPAHRPSSYDELIADIDRLSVELSTMGGPISGMLDLAAISDQQTMAAPAVRSTKVDPQDVAAPADPAPIPLSQTVDLQLPAAAKPSKSNRSRVFSLIVIAIALILATIGLTLYQSLGEVRGPRPYTRVVETVGLYDGVTLSGWDVGGSMIGAWNTVEAPDASNALACLSRQGALTRRLEGKLHPRISIFVWAQPGFEKVDIDFSFDPSVRDDLRGSLRFTPSEIILGEKQGDFEELSNQVSSASPPDLFERYHVVHFERQPTDWYVFFEQRLVGTIPISRVGSGAAIRLVVHPSPGTGSETPSPNAYFSEVRLDNLAEPKAADPRPPAEEG